MAEVVSTLVAIRAAPNYWGRIRTAGVVMRNGQYAIRYSNRLNERHRLVWAYLAIARHHVAYLKCLRCWPVNALLTGSELWQWPRANDMS